MNKLPESLISSLALIRFSLLFVLNIKQTCHSLVWAPQIQLTGATVQLRRILLIWLVEIFQQLAQRRQQRSSTTRPWVFHARQRRRHQGNLQVLVIVFQVSSFEMFLSLEIYLQPPPRFSASWLYSDWSWSAFIKFSRNASHIWSDDSPVFNEQLRLSWRESH